MSKVSVVIPVYNSEKYIGKCLDSIMNQTYKDIEIIVINDGSKDNSQKIINEYAKKYSNIIAIEQENMGVSKTRNKAIEIAKSEYIMFIDNDDYIDKDYIEIHLNEIEKNNLDIVISGYRRPNNKGKIVRVLKLKDTEWSKMMLLTPWAKIYRKQFITENNIKFLPNNIGEDIYFNLQAMLLTDKIKILDYIGYNWFYNTDSVSNTSQRNFKNIKVFYLLDECYNKLQELNLLEEKYEIIEMHFIRYIIWFLSFSTRKQKYKDISEIYDKLFEWLEEKFPNFQKNKLVGFGKPKGEIFGLQIAFVIFLFAHKIKLGKILVYIYSKR